MQVQIYAPRKQQYQKLASSRSGLCWPHYSTMLVDISEETYRSLDDKYLLIQPIDVALSDFDHIGPALKTVRNQPAKQQILLDQYRNSAEQIIKKNYLQGLMHLQDQIRRLQTRTDHSDQTLQTFQDIQRQALTAQNQYADVCQQRLWKYFWQQQTAPRDYAEIMRTNTQPRHILAAAKEYQPQDFEQIIHNLLQNCTDEQQQRQLTDEIQVMLQVEDRYAAY